MQIVSTCSGFTQREGDSPELTTEWHLFHTRLTDTFELVPSQNKWVECYSTQTPCYLRWSSPVLKEGNLRRVDRERDRLLLRQQTPLNTGYRDRRSSSHDYKKRCVHSKLMYVLQENTISDFTDIPFCLIVKCSSNFWVKIQLIFFIFNLNTPILLDY